MKLRPVIICALATSLSLAVAPVTVQASPDPPARPNILLVVADDQSAGPGGSAGPPVTRSPAFDRIARQGVQFRHAFVQTPSCTASRSALVTGQAPWRLEEGGILIGTLHARYGSFVHMLEDSGYVTGHTGKGWGPGLLNDELWKKRDPVGTPYQRHKGTSANRGLTPPCDYAANFAEFLGDRPVGRPFFFWYGPHEPHRPFARGAGKTAGLKPEDITVPPFLPDVSEVRGDLLDYIAELEHADVHLDRMLRMLEDRGELDDTLVIVTSDHGIPFPRAKSNLYDAGTHVPLAICWPRQVPAGRVVKDLVDLTDLAPTLLEAARLPVPKSMTGKSLLPILRSSKSGRVDSARDAVVMMFERHVWSRPDGVGYPMRAIRTHDYLYIRNYEPTRWPAGDPGFRSPYHPVDYADIDGGPTKSWMIAHRSEPAVKPLFDLAFGRRAAEELYDLADDPHQLDNIAGDPGNESVLTMLRQSMENHLRATGDPRMKGEAPWDQYSYGFAEMVRRARNPR